MASQPGSITQAVTVGLDTMVTVLRPLVMGLPAGTAGLKRHISNTMEFASQARLCLKSLVTSYDARIDLLHQFACRRGHSVFGNLNLTVIVLP